MAEVGTQNDLIILASIEDERLQQKKIATNNEEWQAQGGEHGSGFIPEDEWKIKYSPFSQERTEI